LFDTLSREDRAVLIKNVCYHEIRMTVQPRL